MLRLLLLLPIAIVLSSCASQKTAANQKPTFGTGWEASAYTSGVVGTGRR
jgi:hypothetical protein